MNKWGEGERQRENRHQLFSSCHVYFDSQSIQMKNYSCIVRIDGIIVIIIRKAPHSLYALGNL